MKSALKYVPSIKELEGELFGDFEIDGKTIEAFVMVTMDERILVLSADTPTEFESAATIPLVCGNERRSWHILTGFEKQVIDVVNNDGKYCGTYALQIKNGDWSEVRLQLVKKGYWTSTEDMPDHPSGVAISFRK